MPNMWGQPHPWERAGVTRDVWYRMLQRVTKAHVAADTALSNLFPEIDRPGDPFTFEEFDQRKKLAERRQRDFFDAINGDGPRILELLDEFGDGVPAAG